MEGNLRFKIDWASLIVGRKFTVFALFYFVFEDNFQVQAPGGLIFGGAIKRRVFCVTNLGGLYMEGLIFRILLYLGSIYGDVSLNNFSFCRVYMVRIKGESNTATVRYMY